MTSTMSHSFGSRHGTPEAQASNLRPPQPRNASGGHHLRASADMGGFPHSNPSIVPRTQRPTSEIFLNGFSSSGLGVEDPSDKLAQQWMADIDQYENTLEDMAAATLDQDFKEELSAIEQWFRVLAEPERTASLYALLQQTTQVQIRFFIQVLQQMAKNHPMAGVLSPANFNEKDAMTARMTDAITKLNVEGARNSFAFGTKPPLSPGINKRLSSLDPGTINSMFPDAAAAIAKQKADLQEHTGNGTASKRSSLIMTDRVAGQLSARLGGTEDGSRKDINPPLSPSPWNVKAGDATFSNLSRTKSTSERAPMGQFNAGSISSGNLRSPRPLQINGDGNLQTSTISAAETNPATMPMLSPYTINGSWASMVNTPLVSNFQNPQVGHANGPSQTDMMVNATAMKLAALSTVNNRLQLDDARKFRRTKSNDAQAVNGGINYGMPNTNILMTNEHGQVLSPQQAAALQAQQLAVMQGMRSRPNSPGIALHHAGMSTVNVPMSTSNGFLTAYDGSLLSAGLPMLNTGMGMGEGYISDHSDARGRSPRARRGGSKPPEDPTDIALLSDIPAWLRQLRLHKYTDNLKDMRWQDLVQLDDAGLEQKGVNALGARRKLLKVFEQVNEAQQEGKL